MKKEMRAAVAAWEASTGKKINLDQINAAVRTLGFDPRRAIEAGRYEGAIDDMRRVCTAATPAEGIARTIAYMRIIRYDYALRVLVEPANASQRWNAVKVFEAELIKRRGMELPGPDEAAAVLAA